MYDLVLDALQQLPTIGPVAAKRLLKTFGEKTLAAMLEDNVYEFVNLMDENGDLVFSDRQAKRMERRLANFEFSIGQGLSANRVHQAPSSQGLLWAAGGR